MNLIEAVCLTLAKSSSLPAFKIEHAKLISQLSRNKELNVEQISSLTGIERSRVEEILHELQELSFVYCHNEKYSLADPIEVMNTIVSLAEAKIRKINGKRKIQESITTPSEKVVKEFAYI